MKRKKIFLVGGTRPNFVKLSPLWNEFMKNKNEFNVKLINAGQHYNYEMSQIFFKEFLLPKPHYSLNILPGSHGSQTAQVITKLEEVLLKDRPDLVVVVGDVNSTLASAIASVKVQIPIAHVEAGLRSFDTTMPEEINRMLTDRVSSFLFVSEPSGVVNLKKEGITQGVYFVGNIMIDSLKNNLTEIKRNIILKNIGVNKRDYGIVTLHRPSNVDNKQNLKQIIDILNILTYKRKFVFPVHPRTEKNIKVLGLEKEFRKIKNLVMIKPLGYFEFMNLVINSELVVTDSGGIQEETTWLGIPCITLRENTERPVTITEGTNFLTGLNVRLIKKSLLTISTFKNKSYKPPQYWDGNTAKRIIDIFKKI